MLSQRQIEILLELCEQPDRCHTASYFADKLNVSLRTIQTDIKIIKDEIKDVDCIRFITEVPKGSRIHIEDINSFASFKDSLYKQYADVSMSYQTGRINQILHYLLNQHRAVSMISIENKIYVSHSTLVNDLKKVSNVLAKYNLELLRNDNKVLIDGTEINKRLLLSDIPPEKPHASIEEKTGFQIKDILLETLMKHKYLVSETEANNAIIILKAAIQRMWEDYYINAADLNFTEALDKERDISEDLFRRFERRFLIRATDEEIDYFALYLKGQENIKNAQMISNEMDGFISDTLIRIKDIFGIDFTENIELRISLALHCTPLLIRIKYDMQVKNNMLEHIKQTYPQGYDLAVYFSYLLQEKYSTQISEDEIAFIGIYFYSALVDINTNQGTKSIVVITSLKRSSALLLRQIILKWFAAEISKLDFISPNEVTEATLDYDVLLTTESDKYIEKDIAMPIKPLPDNQDYLNIKLAIEGFKNINDFANIFSEDLFKDGKGMEKDQILEALCSIAQEKYSIAALYDEVMLRESIRSTYFSKSVAVPHPMHAVSSSTFVAVSISSEPIIWDDDNNEVNLILLVCIGKNNPQAFQLWNYLSKMFTDSEFIKQVTRLPSYNKFISTINKSFSSWIKDNEAM